jgi:hypothetical protein
MALQGVQVEQDVQRYTDHQCPVQQIVRGLVQGTAVSAKGGELLVIPLGCK